MRSIKQTGGTETIMSIKNTVGGGTHRQVHQTNSEILFKIR